jgi:hypothetical protein
VHQSPSSCFLPPLMGQFGYSYAILSNLMANLNGGNKLKLKFQIRRRLALVVGLRISY